MKKAALATLLIVIVAVAGGAWLVLSQIKQSAGAETDSNQTNEAYQTPAVHMSDFKWDGWGVPVGVTAAIGFNVTIHNLETNDVAGLTLEAKMLNASGSELQTGIVVQELLDGSQYKYFDGKLQAGEARTLEVSVFTDFNTANGVWARAQGLTTTIISVNLGNVVLDELEVTH